MFEHMLLEAAARSQEMIKVQHDLEFKTRFINSISAICEEIVRPGVNVDSPYTDPILKPLFLNVNEMIQARFNLNVKLLTSRGMAYIYRTMDKEVNANNIDATTLYQQLQVIQDLQGHKKVSNEDLYSEDDLNLKNVSNYLLKNMGNLHALARAGKLKVDLDKAKIIGDTSSIEAVMAINFKWFIREGYTPSEVAAIILHEIGHQFSAIMYIATKGDQILRVTTALVDEKNGDLPQRFEVAYKEIIGGTPNNPQEAALSVLEAISPAHKNSGDNYNAFNDERSSDLFAMRMGFQEEITSVLSKLLNTNNRGSVPIWLYALTVIATAVAILATPLIAEIAFIIAIVSLIFPISFTIMSTVMYEIPHNTDFERLRLLKMELIREMRLNEFNDRKELKSLIASIETVERTAKKLARDKGVRDMFADVVNRKGVAWHQLHSRIESMIDNDLYVNMVRLKDKIN